jgi:hypothetical protein
MAKASDWDYPIVYALSITFVVVGMMSVMSWFFASTNMTGPLGLVKGGVI